MPGNKCENKSCNAVGKLRCSRCTSLGLSQSFGKYCSAACQEICFPSHKVFHNKRFQQSYAWTILIALKELDIIGQLPGLNLDGSFAIYLFGCRDGGECQGRSNDLHEFSSLFDNLRRTLFPSILNLCIHLSGLEVSSAPENCDENRKVVITYTNSSCQNILKSIVSIDHSVAVLFQPGLSSEKYFEKWEPAVRRLVGLNMTTICTGYSHRDHFTYDAVMDERILYSYFLANIIIGTTFNPACLSRGASMGHKNRVYLAFKGQRSATALKPPVVVDGLPLSSPSTHADDAATPVVALTKQQLHSVNQVEFIKSIAFVASQYENNPSLTMTCKRVLRALEAGRQPFDAAVSLEELDQLLMSGAL